jgi:hypothetical protein
VAEKLRRLDQVAYVRFASVYRQFKTLEELVDEAKLVLDARRFDDPDQGKLFVEQANNGNGAVAEQGELADRPKRKARAKHEKPVPSAEEA